MTSTSPDTNPPTCAQKATPPTSRPLCATDNVAAEIHGFLGDPERTLSAVESAARQGLIDRLWLERCPLLDEVRDDPRFQAAHAEVQARTDEILAAYREP